MARSKRLSGAEAVLRDFGLAYPEAWEDFPWDHRSLKVRTKLFAIFSTHEGIFRVTVKLPVSRYEALALAFTEPTGYGLGKSGWVTAAFPEGSEVPTALLREWIDESYRAIAPKKLVTLLNMKENAEPKKKARRPVKHA